MTPESTAFTAFAGDRLLAAGDLPSVLMECRMHQADPRTGPLLIFADRSGVQVDFDLRGTEEEVLARIPFHPLFAPKGEPGPARSGPGRPRLGVVSREVTLLPRHWEWLESRPGGISAALRRLVDEARKRDPEGERLKATREACARVMTALAGDRPGYEEASRALFAGDLGRFRSLTAPWPPDIRDYLSRLAGGGPGRVEGS